jgi:prolyl-tRNA synthetase
MLDDRRGTSPGVKFKDAELIGIPVIVVVGKALEQGNVEVRVRRTGEKSEVPVAQALKAVTELLPTLP